MKFHKKYPHHRPGISFYGKRGEILLRINVSDNPEAESIIEPLHYHKEGTTFFVVIQGSLIVEVDGKEVVVTNEELVEIEPGSKYRVISNSTESKWVAICTKNVDGDRVEL